MEMQMENRAKQCEGKLAEIKQLLENPTMREFGFLAGARVLFDSVVTSTFTGRSATAGSTSSRCTRVARL